jgi:hypothetical protein
MYWCENILICKIQLSEENNSYKLRVVILTAPLFIGCVTKNVAGQPMIQGRL